MDEPKNQTDISPPKLIKGSVLYFIGLIIAIVCYALLTKLNVIHNTITAAIVGLIIGILFVNLIPYKKL